MGPPLDGPLNALQVIALKVGKHLYPAETVSLEVSLFTNQQEPP